MDVSISFAICDRSAAVPEPFAVCASIPTEKNIEKRRRYIFIVEVLQGIMIDQIILFK
jgi:hypothetical protein